MRASVRSRGRKAAVASSTLRSLARLRTRSFWARTLATAAVYVILVDLAFVFLYPFLYMLVTSIKSPVDLSDVTVRWIPRSVHMQNYAKAWIALDYLKHLKNSVLVVGLSTAGHVLSCSFIGYGFARHRFPGRNVFFLFVILSLIIPVQVIIVPLYIQYSKMGWLDSYLPMVVPTFFGFGLRGGLFVFVFRQFFRGLPYELEDAARIDGCGSVRTYWSIVLPISGAAVVVTIVLAMTWHWNDYYEPVIYLLGSPQKRMLPAILPSLYELISGMDPEELGIAEEEIEEMFNRGFVMAATALAMAPMLAAYMVLQRRFMVGVSRTGLTE